MIDKKFCIIAQARSGSTLLRHALNSHPQICCHGEVLSRKWINGLIPKDDLSAEKSRKPIVEKLLEHRNSDISAFLDHNIYSLHAPCVGFKIVYEDLYMSDTSSEIIDYLRLNNILIIHLTRLNLLRAYASRVRMAKFGVTHSDVGSTKNNTEPIRIESQKFHNYSSNQHNYRNLTDSLFRKNIVTRPRYEWIEEDYHEILDKLGMQSSPMQKKLSKVGAHNFADLVSNYDAIKQYDIDQKMFL